MAAKQAWVRSGLLLALLMLPALALAADRNTKNLRPANPDDRTVELFDALDAGEIDVTLIPKDAAQARLLIKNNTQRPLNVKMPAAFAGVPFACFATTNGSEWNSDCANGTIIRTPQAWGDLVRGAYPGYTGPRPRTTPP